MADMNYQLFYPFTWLNLIMLPGLFLKVFRIAHAFGAAVGMTLLARRLGLAAPAALIAGAGWVSAGPWLSLVKYHHIDSAAWMPWVLLALINVIDRQTWRSAVALALAATGQLLAGSADMCHLTAWLAPFCILAMPGTIASRLAARKLKLLGLLAGAGCLAFCLTAPQWLPTIVQIHGSIRSVYTTEHNLYWSLHPGRLIDVLVPMLTNAPLSADVRRDLSESREPFLKSIYFGVTTFPIVLLGIAGSRRRSRLVYGIGTLFFGLASLGRHTFVYPLLLHLPSVSLFRYPVKWIVPASFLWALLVGIGIETYIAAPRTRRSWPRWTAAMLAGLLAGLFGYAAWRVLDADSTLGIPFDAALDRSGMLAVLGIVGRMLLWAASVSALAACLMIVRSPKSQRARWQAGAFSVLILADLVVWGSRVNEFAPPALLAHRPPIVNRLDVDRDQYRIYSAPTPDRRSKRMLAHGPKDWRTEWVWTLGQIERIEPRTSGRWRLFSSFDRDPIDLQDSGVTTVTHMAESAPDAGTLLRVLQTWNVRYVIGLERQRYAFLERIGEWLSVPSTPLCLWRVPDPLPRVYIVGQANHAVGPDAIRMLLSPAFEPRRAIIIEEKAAARQGAASLQGTARIASRRSDQVVIETESNGPGYVVLVEAYDSGWRAEIDDGRPAPILRANLICRAVAIPAGRHRVAFSYRPPALKWGFLLWVSGAFSLVLSWLVWTCRRAHRHEDRTPPYNRLHSTVI
ncbi:MAG: YfhO family protein [Vicinamibacteria bacterium]|nr:YfhO family protein [Vicinamibacteria bacterium]